MRTTLVNVTMTSPEGKFVVQFTTTLPRSLSSSLIECANVCRVEYVENGLRHLVDKPITIQG